MPLEAQTGGNYLATSYFHRGYEIPMMAVAKLSRFDLTLAGNGAEGTSLYGVHKPATIFIESGKGKTDKVLCRLSAMFTRKTASKIKSTYETLKSEEYDLAKLANWGESALKNGTGPAASLIACQAGTLFHLCGLCPSFQEGYDAAQSALHGGSCYNTFMQYINEIRN